MNVMVCPDTGWSGSSVVATISNFLFEVGSLINPEKVDKRRGASACLLIQNLLIVSQSYICKSQLCNELQFPATAALP